MQKKKKKNICLIAAQAALYYTIMWPLRLSQYMNDVDVQHDGVVEPGVEGTRNVFSMCSDRAVQTLSLWLDVSQGTAMQRLDTETQIEDWPPLRYRAWPPTSQNF